jgi:MFS family permease
MLGLILLLTGILSLWFVKEPARTIENSQSGTQQASKPAAENKQSESNKINAPRLPWTIFSLPIGLSCAQGILAFELPLRGTDSATIMSTGILFSIVSLGALVTLGLLFLNRYLPYLRTIFGVLMLAICYYGLASGWPIPLLVLLFAVGMAKGVIFPAMTSFLLQLSGPTRYGRTFSLLSISLSIGSFIGPVAAGAAREYFSPYFISFLALMISLALLFPRPTFRENWNPHAPIPLHHD